MGRVAGVSSTEKVIMEWKNCAMQVFRERAFQTQKKKKKAHEKALLWNMAGKLEVKQAGEGWWSRVESRG